MLNLCQFSLSIAASMGASATLGIFTISRRSNLALAQGNAVKGTFCTSAICLRYSGLTHSWVILT